MSIVVYIPTGLPSPELEILLAKAQAAIDDQQEVIVAGCAGGPGYACSFNIFGMRGLCRVCKSVRRRGIALLKGPFRYMETPKTIEIPALEGGRAATLASRWTIKAHDAEGADVGQSAYSSYIGLARDQDLEGRLSRYSLNRLLATSEQLTSWFRALLVETRATRVVLYNGRQNQYRPLLRVSQQQGIHVEVMEFSGQEARCVYTFEDRLPQELAVLNEYIERTWHEFTGDVKTCGFDYYQFKRQGGVINDHRSYVLGQERGLLPEGWNVDDHNVVIFNSSEDEYAAVGGDYDDTLYAGQTDAITRICTALHNESGIKIWLRMHPNLGTVKWSFARRLLELDRLHANVRVIPPLSPISSYALLDACNTAVSFGSTMGVEAAYWGKPSILVGRCIYERLGSVYTPQTHDDAVAMLRDRRLAPLPVTGALKVALFWSQGGRPIANFGGSRREGFSFCGHQINRTRMERLRYVAFKFLEKHVMGDWLNYRLGVTRQRLAEQRKQCAT